MSEAAATPTVPAGETLDEIRQEAISGNADPTPGPVVPGGTDRPRGKRGRPPGSKNARKGASVQTDTASAEPAVDPRAFAAVVKFPFQFLASRRGPHWNLTPEEEGLLSESVSKVVNKYAGAIGEKYGAEIALVFGLVAVVGSRVLEDAAQAAKRQKTAPPTFDAEVVVEPDFPVGTPVNAPPTGQPVAGDGSAIYAQNS